MNEYFAHTSPSKRVKSIQFDCQIREG